MRLLLTLALALTLIIPQTTLAAGGSNPSVGKPSAPVTMEVWSDYQCPFCKTYDFNTLRKVERDWVKPGKVRIVYRDFPFLGEDSTTAALYSRAVWKTSKAKWSDWNARMFDKQDAENAGFGNAESIRQVVREAGIDLAKVDKNLKKNKKKYMRAIEKNLKTGERIGVNGTPTTVIGSEVIAGAQSYDALVEYFVRAR